MIEKQSALSADEDLGFWPCRREAEDCRIRGLRSTALANADELATAVLSLVSPFFPVIEIAVYDMQCTLSYNDATAARFACNVPSPLVLPGGSFALTLSSNAVGYAACNTAVCCECALQSELLIRAYLRRRSTHGGSENEILNGGTKIAAPSKSVENYKRRNKMKKHLIILAAAVALVGCAEHRGGSSNRGSEQSGSSTSSDQEMNRSGTSTNGTSSNTGAPGNNSGTSTDSSTSGTGQSQNQSGVNQSGANQSGSNIK